MELSIIQCSMKWPKVRKAVAAAMGTMVAGTRRHGGDPLLPESPDAAGQAIGAAEAFHEGKQNAHGGEEADEDAAPDDADGTGVVVDEVVLHQQHGVGRENLLEGGADDAADVVAGRHDGEEGGDNDQRGEDAEHGRIGRSLGHGEGAMAESGPDGSPQMLEPRAAYGSTVYLR